MEAADGPRQVEVVQAHGRRPAERGVEEGRARRQDPGALRHPPRRGREAGRRVDREAPSAPRIDGRRGERHEVVVSPGRADSWPSGGLRGTWMVRRGGYPMVEHDMDRELATHARIDADASEARSGSSGREGSAGPSRRAFLRGAAAAAAGAALVDALQPGTAFAKTAPNLAAQPPSGFVPFSAPGRVVRVKKAGCLEANNLFPKPADAKEMLRRSLEELTGKADMAEAAKLIVHPEDKVCVKVNGIALQNMATNKELVLPFVDAMIASGVPAANITILEQYPGFMHGTRINASNVPAGVSVVWHSNNDATMDWGDIPGTQRHTKFVRALTDSTALINFALVKDHSICGYTGALKNMTHGCSVNPQDFHDHHASPQIAILSAQDVLRSRLRLCVFDG